MALTPSNMLPLGTLAPEFSLPDTVSGSMIELPSSHQAPATVVMFLSNHCPYVKHIKPVLAEVSATWMEQGVRVYAISSNDISRYPDDSPEKMKADAEQFAYPFPYLYDESQQVAKAYQAACTPDFFVFDAQRKLVYRGQFDDSRPGNEKPVTGKDLSDAVLQVLKGGAVSQEQKPSIGCNIKWK